MLFRDKYDELGFYWLCYDLEFRWLKLCQNSISWLIYDIDKLRLGVVVLFHIMSHSIWLLWFNGGIISSTNNNITYNRESNEFWIAKLNMYLIKLKRSVCCLIGWNLFEIKVDFTWRMKVRIHHIHYVDALILCVWLFIFISIDEQHVTHWNKNPSFGTQKLNF